MTLAIPSDLAIGPSNNNVTDGQITDGQITDAAVNGFDAVSDGLDAAPNMLDLRVDSYVPCFNLNCALGCNIALNRCNRLAPSNYAIAEPIYNQISAELKFTQSTASINTDTGEILDGTTYLVKAPISGQVTNGIFVGEQAQTSPYPTIRIIGANKITISSATTLTVTGTRALAFFALDDVTISGKIEAAGNKVVSGPGGFSGGLKNGAAGGGIVTLTAGGGSESGSGSWELQSGGGGGGFGAAGGKGADAIYTNYPTAPGGVEGKSFGSLALTPLCGGEGGAAGGGPDTGSGQEGTGGYGGGGGGAIQISSEKSIKIDSAGGIDVGGAGGEGGHYGAGGGGGGAGGGILLEAASINFFSGYITANGGGGGGGGFFTSTANCNAGSNGLHISSPAGGGAACGGAYSGPGGAGGYGLAATQVGINGTSNFNSGGGGGGAGRIRLNYLTTSRPETGMIISPAANFNNSLNYW